MRTLVLSFLVSLPASSVFSLESIERFELPNGLTVLVAVDGRLPLVNVTCLYRVGSANERPGITGIAHYVEHMAFRATENVSHADVTGTMERIGGRWNGYTWIDQTLYASTVPSWALDSVLRIEAERMSRVLFDPVAFELERSSVMAELQGYENDPASILRDIAVAASFEIHPYRYNVVGWLGDVLRIQRDEALGFYRDFYGPNQAYLSVVGDVDPAEVRRLVERHFATLPRSRRSAEVPVVEPVQKGEKTVALRHPGTVANLLLVFRAPEAGSRDFPAFLVLDSVLAGGRGLLFGGRSAFPGTPLWNAVEEAGGFGASTSLTASRAPFVYEIAASARSASELPRLERSLHSLLRRLAEEGPAGEELERARLQIRAEASYESASLADAAQRLSYYEALGSHRRAGEILDLVERVQGEDVKRLAREALSEDRRTVGRHVPGDAVVAPASLPEPPREETAPSPASPVPDRALEPLDAPDIEVVRRTLSNGASLLAAGREGSSASLHLRLSFGSALDPRGKEGLALLAARLLQGGSALLSSLSEAGARATSSAVRSPADASHREHFDLEVEYLPEHQDRVFAAVGRALSGAEEDLDRAKESILDDIAELEGDATWIAERKALERVDPSWRPPFGSEESIRAISAEDLRQFLSRVRVGGAVIAAAASPVPPSDTLSALARSFEPVPAGTPPASDKSPSQPNPGEERTPISGKTQAEVVAALPGLSRDHEDALPLRLLSYVIGETGYAGRLGDRLVDEGLTYSVYTAPELGRSPGPLLLFTGTAPSNLEEVLSTIREVLTDLGAEGVTEAEHRECRAFRSGRLVLGLDSPSALARALVESAYSGEDLLDLPARSREILEISRERLNEVARRYLRPELLTVSVAGALP